jgi:regulatory protein
LRRFRPNDTGGPDEEGAGVPAATEKTVEAAAVALLARREHSVEELRRKLLSKRHPAALVESVVAKLTAKRLVSDARFTGNFVHHHARRGQGPIRIRAELRQQGIGDEAIGQSLAQAEVDWNALAVSVRRRKFGSSPPQSLAERAKQARFLQYRGFTSDQIRAALNSDVESDGSATQADAGFDLDLDS